MNPVDYPVFCPFAPRRFRILVSVLAQQSAFAFGVLSDPYAFHRPTGSKEGVDDVIDVATQADMDAGYLREVQMPAVDCGICPFFGGHLPKKEDRGHSTKEGTSSSDKSETMGSQPTEQKNAKTDSPGEIVNLQQDWGKEPMTRPDEPTKSNLQPATPQSESKPSMQQAGSKPDQSDEAGTERLHSTV
ncbi:hypothetical protein L7F22_044501 [Adiantum nelumboides]|nr:hypothetical protein [Adiantum nelumboides]